MFIFQCSLFLLMVLCSSCHWNSESHCPRNLSHFPNDSYSSMDKYFVCTHYTLSIEDMAVNTTEVAFTPTERAFNWLPKSWRPGFCDVIHVQLLLSSSPPQRYPHSDLCLFLLNYCMASYIITSAHCPSCLWVIVHVARIIFLLHSYHHITFLPKSSMAP